jgi:D-alanyl-lipoteichoic acid acyltransferase DltB (MBOAT superfamily)
LFVACGLPEPIREDLADLGEGGFLVLLGLFKKVAVADNLAPLVHQGFTGGPHQGAAGTAVAVVAFALQIYGDFSGYSDMARGLARLLGFEIMRNFDVPYLSSSIPEFWRRWHISLSSWLRDYLYIPLGGNRSGRGRTAVNLMVTMLLGGLWHGASWTFVFWGGYHGALLALSRALERAGILRADGKVSLPARAASVAMTFGLVCGGWLLFRAESLPQAWGMLVAAAARPWSGAFGANGAVSAALVPLGAWGACLAALDLWTLNAGEDVFIRRWGWLAQAALVLLMFYGVVLFGSREEHAFVYFQF